MPAPRDWLTLSLRPSAGAPAGGLSVPPFRPMGAGDAEGLAVLMLESYRGSVDDEGETLDDARREVGRLLSGVFGALDGEASIVLDASAVSGAAAEDRSPGAAVLASATIVTRDRVAPAPLTAGEAFLAFSMTAPAWRRRGLARAGLLRVIGTLRERGEPRLHLVVTRTNTPAVGLYRSLGFEPGPVGDQQPASKAPTKSP